MAEAAMIVIVTPARGTTAAEAAIDRAVAMLAGSPSGSKAADGPGTEDEIGIAAVAVTMSTGTVTAVDTTGGPVRPGAPDGIPTDAGGPRMRSGPAKARCIPLRKCR